MQKRKNFDPLGLQPSDDARQEYFADSQLTLAQTILAAKMNMTACTISLTGNVVLTTQLPPIESDITIDGQGYIIAGDTTFQIFEILDGHLRIDNLTIINGKATNRAEWGGAIYVSEGSKLSLNNCICHNNSAGKSGMGGAIFNNGNTAINRSTFHRNTAGDGGAIVNNGGSMIVSDCIFSANAASGIGGGICNVGDIIITKSALVKNSSAYGGAIWTDAGTVQISNSTFSSNSAQYGGSIYHETFASAGYDVAACIITLTHVTIAYNSASTGGGVFVKHKNIRRKRKHKQHHKHKHHSMVNMRNSIIAGNTNGDCFGTLNQNINNLIEDGSCNPALSGDPMLAPLTGSPAFHPLMPGSPAINAAHPDYSLLTDQVGMPRPQGSAGDIGAYELPWKQKRLIDLLVDEP